MKYEGKVTITLENTEGVKISRPFDVEFDEDQGLGESPFLFKKAINIVDRVLVADVQQMTLGAFERHDAAQKAAEEEKKLAGMEAEMDRLKAEEASKAASRKNKKKGTEGAS